MNSQLTFHVKNFDTFQHYRDRTPPWIKLYNELLDDYDFCMLPDASKSHLIAIWLLASRSGNKIPYDADWIFRRISATEPVDLDTLVRSGFIVPDQALQTTEQVASNVQAKCLSREREEGETETEREGERKKRARGKILAPWSERDRGLFWEIFPNKVGKAAAMKAFDRATLRTTPDVMFPALRSYAAKTDDRPFCNPATWLNQDRWLDRPASQPVRGVSDNQRKTREILDALGRSTESSEDGGAPNYRLLPDDSGK